MSDNLNSNDSLNSEEIFLDIASDEIMEEKSSNKKQASSFFELINNYLIEVSGVPLKDKLLFFQLLSAIISAGLPILEGLGLLQSQMKNPKLKLVINSIISSVEDGNSLAQAMRENGDIFDEATCSVVEAGEKSGKLNDVMKELVDQNEQLDSISKKIKAVMTYPV